MKKTTQITTIEQAKDLVLEKTNIAWTPELAQRRIVDFKKFEEQADAIEAKKYWREQREKVEEKINNPKLFEESPQGIDEIVLNLVEWRAMIYAFQQIESKENPFQTHYFFQLWLNGGSHAIFNYLGQLLNDHKDDNSLRNLWQAVSRFIVEDGSAGKDEVEKIDELMNKKHGRFNNEKSSALRFRNKAIGHNECRPRTEWSTVDDDLKILIRTWSLLVSWTSFGVFAPFVDGNQAFSALHSIYTFDEISKLIVARAGYLEMVKVWAKTHVHNNEIDNGRSAFGELKTTTTLSRL